MQLPAWAGRKGVGLKLTTRSQEGTTSRAAAASGFGLEQLVDFRIDLVIGDGVVTAEELAELARLKVPLVRVRGQWVELDDRQLKAALKAVGPAARGRADRRRGAAAGDRRRRRGPAAGRGGRRRDARRPALRAGGRAAHAAADAGRLPRHACGRTRNGVCPGCTSWPGSGWAASSPTTWASARPRRRCRCCSPSAPRPSRCAPTLLVCPMSLVSNWQKEAARFAPEPAGVRAPRRDPRATTSSGRGGRRPTW